MVNEDILEATGKWVVLSQSEILIKCTPYEYSKTYFYFE